jgi:hypothetical protein
MMGGTMLEVRTTNGYLAEFQREDHEIVTLYWMGSLDETRDLAKQIALNCGADIFRIMEFTLGAAEGSRRGRTLGAVRLAEGERRVGAGHDEFS